MISDLRKGLSGEMLYGNSCVLCHKEEVKICSYCFFVKVAKIMKRTKLSEELIQALLADFNYHVEREAEFMSLIK